jgi:hypothetical protein
MKQLPKIQPTNRKFYNKWFNKLSFHLPGGRMLSFHSTSDLINFITFPDKVTGRWQKVSVANMVSAKQDWLKFIFLLNTIPSGGFQKRSESDVINIYTNDENFIKSAKQDLGHRLVEIFEPTEESMKLLDTEEKILIVKKLPYNKFNFRVIIKPHRLNQLQREQFIQFLDNSPGIGLQDSVRNFIRTNEMNWDRRYIYVDTEKTLTMLKIACADAVSTIHRYVINDK